MGKSVNELLDDLYNVGNTKSLGYLPIKTITEICNKNIEDIVTYAKKNNINTLILNYPKECTVYSGAVYMYDKGMLTNLLNKYSDILSKAGIPYNNPLKYIKYIAKNHIEEKYHPEAYKVVGLTFNDKRFASLYL